MYLNLRKIRKDNKLSGVKLSQLLGFKSPSAYYKKENGKIPFTLDEIKLVSELFKKDIEEIFLKK